MTSPRYIRKMTFIENNLALGLLAIAIINVERMVKFYITENLRIGESIPVIGHFLMITRAENRGAAFGIMQGANWVFLLAAIAVFVMIIIYYNRIIYDRLLVFTTSFILAGTVGNMLDRIYYSGVIDFIDFSFWPTFNISDASLTIGVIMLGIYMYFWQREPQTKKGPTLAKY